MGDLLGGISRFFRELKRRNVYRVAITYAVVAFALWQIADFLFPALRFPAWTTDFVVVLTLLGFPVALVLAWAFELTPEGVRRTPSLEAESAGAGEATAKPSPEGSGAAARALVGLGLVAAAAAGVWYLTAGGGATGPRAGPRSIAVLPFENMGGEESEQFTQGIHDGLLTRLSNVSGLKVISRTSVMQFRETRLPLPAIADSLGVKWVMEGGVQKMGEQIQVNAQLIDPRTDTHAWAEQYRRDLTATDLFAIQSEITKKIAGSLEARLTPEEQRRVERRPTGDLEAYRLYVRGRNLLARRTPESIREASDYFGRALEQDSAYALAWAGLADAMVLYAAWSSTSIESFRQGMKAAAPRATKAARRARELAPDLAEAWAALGAIRVYEQQAGLSRGNGPPALAELRRAVELKPSYAHAQQWLAETYLRLGRPDRGLEHASLAVELNPRHAAARQVYIWNLMANGRGEEAWGQLRSHPHDFPAWFEGVVYYHAGRWDELERRAAEAVGSDLSETELPRFYMARIAVLRGDTATAREQLRSLRREQKSYGAGLVLAALGRHDAALETWTGIEEWHGYSFEIRYWYPDVLDPLRSDARFRQVLRDLNAEWGLNPDGSLPEESGG